MRAAWPFVGGLHAAAVAVTAGAEAAQPLLRRVARAVAIGDWAFPEWISADGLPQGARQQTWNAGAYLYAHRRIEPTA